MKQNKWLVLLLSMLLSMLVLSNVACSSSDDDDDDDTVANDDDDTMANDDDTMANDDDTMADDDDTMANDDDDDTGPPPGGIHVEVPCDAGDEITLDLPATVVVMDPLGGNFDLPVGLGPILQGLVPPGSIPPILFGAMELNGDELTMIGAIAAEGLPVEQDMSQPTLGIPEPADFSCNPYMDLAMDLFDINISGFQLSIEQMQITGKLHADGSMSEGTLSGIIDPAPLAVEFGLDPCALLPEACNADGLIEVLISGLVGEASDIVLVEVTE